MKKFKPGFILPTVLIFMALLFVLGSGMIILSFPEFFFLSSATITAGATQVADAGVREALCRINRGNTADFTNNISPSFSSGGPVWGTYSVVITPDPDNSTPGHLKRFHIKSTGWLNAKPQLVKKVDAVAQSLTYANYLSYSDLDNPQDIFIPGDRVEGPVSSNGNLYIQWDPSVNSNPPIFGSKTVAADNVIWSYGGGYSTPPSTEDEYKKLFDYGKAALKTNRATLAWPLPSGFSYADAFATQRAQTLGNWTGEPGSEGVFLPDSGGIFIKGDVKKCIFSVNSGNQVITLTDPYNNQAVITLNYGSNSTTLTDFAGVTTTAAGLPKPMLYSTGGVTEDLSGDYKWQGTMFFADKVHINNHLLADNNGNGVLESGEGKMGIVTPSIILNTSAPVDLKVQASCFCSCENCGLGSFMAEDPNCASKGSLNLTGSLIQRKVGLIGSATTGYRKNFRYDNRLSDNPPPYFPYAEKYLLRFWQLEN